MAEQVARADAWFGQVEDRLVMLVTQAIRKIVQGYDERDRVVHSLRSALAVVRNQKQITVRVHPDRLDDVKARTHELAADYPGAGLLDVVADARVAADACVIESEIGIVEAGTEAQLAALEAALGKARRAAS
jgi:type III secretion protein L